MKYSKRRTKKNKNGMNGGDSDDENSHSSRVIIQGVVDYSICALCTDPNDENSIKVHSHVTNRRGPPHIFHTECIYDFFYHESNGNTLTDRVKCPICELNVNKLELFMWIYRRKIFSLQTNLEHMTLYLNSVLVRINSLSEDQTRNGPIRTRLLNEFSRILPDPNSNNINNNLQNAIVPREQNAIVHQEQNIIVHEDEINRLNANLRRMMDDLRDSTNIAGSIIARNLINLDNYFRLRGLDLGYGIVIATGVYILFDNMRKLLSGLEGGGERSINENSEKKYYRLRLPINKLEEFCNKLDKDEEFKKNREKYFNEPIIISIYPKKSHKSSKESKKHPKHNKSRSSKELKKHPKHQKSTSSKESKKHPKHPKHPKSRSSKESKKPI
jgi:hypothetical protein